jgi:hypothetical protein
MFRIGDSNLLDRAVEENRHALVFEELEGTQRTSLPKESW